MKTFPLTGVFSISIIPIPTRPLLPLVFDLQLINSGNPVLATESCDITMSLSNISFSSVYGYLGDYDVLVSSGEVPIDIFSDSLRGGTLLFADPRITLDVDNSYGMPMQVELSNVSAYSKIKDVTTDIAFNGVNPFLIGAPDISHIGDTVNTKIGSTRITATSSTPWPPSRAVSSTRCGLLPIPGDPPPTRISSPIRAT